MAKKVTGFVPRPQKSPQPFRNVLRYQPSDLQELVDQLKGSGLPDRFLGPLIQLVEMTVPQRLAAMLSSTLGSMANGGDSFPKNAMSQDEYRLLCVMRDYNIAPALQEKVSLALLIQDRYELFIIMRPTFRALLGEDL